MKEQEFAKKYFISKTVRYNKVNSTNTRVKFLIFCEGECSEPNYFNGLNKMCKNIHIVVDGKGCNTQTLVKKAIQQRKIIQQKYEDIYDYSWVVFDKDDFPDVHFDNAIKEAQANNFECAWSNEGFELWYLLHFEYRNTGMKRNDYKIKLSKYLKEEYKKNDVEIFHKLKTFTEQAIKNGEKLEKINEKKRPCNCNPGTMVHKLVSKILNENKKFESRY